ncbi:MAG TPA: lanthionine synthetase LanC family protein [Thermomicrobiales bacterium]|nr:lanthionine synthetase LanC family protein [Thermomicrobiales bacterium]
MWDPVPTSGDFLAAAVDTAQWIRSTGQPAAHGITWLPEPDHPERVATVTAPPTIYSGNAGIVLFLLELAAATGDASYLEDAKRGVDQIAATWRDVLAFPFVINLEHVNLDFNHGLSGTAFTLAKVWQATGEPRYRDAALDVTRFIAGTARPAGTGVVWTGAPSAALGDGAIALYLLWAARAFGDPSLRDLARQAGKRILEVAESDPRGGLRWTGFPFSSLGMNPDAYMPNFEFGTAGVAFVLARLYEETGDPRFLTAAREGASHVQSLATVRGDAALLHLQEPDHRDIFYLGYCGGPVGTARLFHQLFRMTEESEYAEWTARFARGVSQSGIPERQTPGLWNVVCQCCGTAGIVDFFIGLWAATSDQSYLAFARRVAEQLLSQASNLDGKGNRWYQAWTRTQPGVVTAETGYMIGAAGVGSAFIHLARAEEHRYEAILFPDNPFPARVHND